jgi:hypothetical protein
MRFGAGAVAVVDALGSLELPSDEVAVMVSVWLSHEIYCDCNSNLTELIKCAST